MPTYEYRCKSCSERLEVVQSFTDDALTDCPACGAAGQLRKVFGNIGITFKGSGFYKTDSRNGSSAVKTPSEPTTDSSKSDTSKSDAKPSGETTSASKPETKKSDSSSGSTSAA